MTPRKVLQMCLSAPQLTLQQAGQGILGHYVLRHHRLMGTFLHAMGSGEQERLDAKETQKEQELPQEAHLWPPNILQRFLVSGQRPRWSSEVGKDNLALDGMSELQVEEGLRTAALWWSRADAVIVLA
ncbi:unnamed protein product, partial [Durusdinium trenchii]